MTKIEKFSKYSKLNEDKINKRITAGILTTIINFNLVNIKDNNYLGNDYIEKSISLKDLEKLKEISNFCYSLNVGNIDFGDIKDETLDYLEVIETPLISIENDTLIENNKIIIETTINKIAINFDKNNNKILLEKINKLENKDFIKIETLKSKNISLSINKAQEFINTQIDLELKEDIIAIYKSKNINLNISQSYFVPSFKMVRLIEDFIKATYEMDGIKVFTTLGVFNDKMIPGSKAIGLEFRF